MRPRPLFLVLTVALLLGQVGCAWGRMADPCCKGEPGRAAEVAATHDKTSAPEPDADHALHAGHCHCLFQVVAAVAVTVPLPVATVWPPHPTTPPAATPQAIDYPPEACA